LPDSIAGDSSNLYIAKFQASGEDIPSHFYKWGFIDKKGNVIIDAVFEKAEEFSEGLAKVCIEDKCGFINSKGKFVIDPIYENVEFLSDPEDLIAVASSIKEEVEEVIEEEELLEEVEEGAEPEVIEHGQKEDEEGASEEA